MKIRAITIGINLSCPVKVSTIEKGGHFLARAKKVFSDAGYEVQTVRLTSQPWNTYLGRLSRKEIVKGTQYIEELCREHGIGFVSMGTAYRPQEINHILDIITNTTIVSVSATIASKTTIDYTAAEKTARVIKEIATHTDKGYGNFRLAALANCPEDIPFYPASYHKGKTCFAIAPEASDLVYKACADSKNILEAEKSLVSVLEHEFKKVERIARKIERTEKTYFKGIDVSPAPSVKRNESLAFAFEKLGLGTFGSSGTLAIAGMITRVLRCLRVRACGFSGLMLPVMEDYGLAQRYSEGAFGIDTLLAYSSICGTGLDCVPLPGDIPVQKLYAILMDMATISVRLNKPLSARLLPVPNKKAGHMTDFKSQYLVDCKLPHIA